MLSPCGRCQLALAGASGSDGLGYPSIPKYSQSPKQKGAGGVPVNRKTAARLMHSARLASSHGSSETPERAWLTETDVLKRNIQGNLIAMASNLEAMASNLLADGLLAMAFDLLAMASNSNLCKVAQKYSCSVNNSYSWIFVMVPTGTTKLTIFRHRFE